MPPRTLTYPCGVQTDSSAALFSTPPDIIRITVGNETGNERGSNLNNRNLFSWGKYNRSVSTAYLTACRYSTPTLLSLPLRSIITFISAIMNNQQFRRLVLDTPSASNRANKASPVDETSPRQVAGVAGATPRALALGSRMRSSIPMTPYVTPSCHPRILL